jgi:hypothetical protein
VLGVRRRDEIVSGGQGHRDVCARLRISYVAVLGLLNYRAADDVHSREDTAPNSAGGTDPNDAGGAGPNSVLELAQTAPVELAQTVPAEPNQTPVEPPRLKPPAAILQTNAWFEKLRSLKERAKKGGHAVTMTDARASGLAMWVGPAGGYVRAEVKALLRALCVFQRQIGAHVIQMCRSTAAWRGQCLYCRRQRLTGNYNWSASDALYGVRS